MFRRGVMLTTGQAGLQSFLRRVSAEADEARCSAGVVGDVTRQGSHIRRGRAEHAGSRRRYMHALMTARAMHANEQQVSWSDHADLLLVRSKQTGWSTCRYQDVW
jgi:phage-related minor tail protein